MKTRAIRIHGKNDLRLDEFELPELKDDEILAEVVTNSVCMSSHKAAILGAEHKRVPDNVAENPTIVGHEFSGYIREVGPKWKDQFKAGQKFSIQPAVEYKGSLDAPGYSFPYIGGQSSLVIVPHFFMELDCLLPYDADSFYKASLSEPMSCIIGAVHAQYHNDTRTHSHKMGIEPGGTCSILAGAGPMGLGCVDYLVNGPVQPKLLVVTDIDDARLKRAEQLISPADAAKRGVDLRYMNTAGTDDAVGMLMGVTGGEGYDDVFVYAPVAPVIQQGDAILGRDGCLNFFAGPTDTEFSVPINMYNVHYGTTHVVGTSGGNTNDMREALDLMSSDKINPSAMITHVGGLTCAVDTIMDLPDIPGGKKLIYTQCDFPLLELSQLSEMAGQGEFYEALADICKRHDGLWNDEAERYVLENGPKIS